MSHCPDTETLAALGSLLHWNAAPVLEHLSQCENCREELHVLGEIHHTFAAHATSPAFVAQVMDALEAHGAQQSASPGAAAEPPGRVRNFLALWPLVSFCLWVVLQLPSTPRANTLPPLLVQMLIAVVAGLLFLWWGLDFQPSSASVHRRTEAASSGA